MYSHYPGRSWQWVKPQELKEQKQGDFILFEIIWETYLGWLTRWWRFHVHWNQRQHSLAIYHRSCPSLDTAKMDTRQKTLEINRIASWFSCLVLLNPDIANCSARKQKPWSAPAVWYAWSVSINRYTGEWLIQLLSHQQQMKVGNSRDLEPQTSSNG